MTTPERIWVDTFRQHEGFVSFAGADCPGNETQRNADHYIRTDLVDAMIAEAVAKERERCAAICDAIDNQCGLEAGLAASCAAAIRAGKGE